MGNTLSIKDKSNLINYNIWSGTDYLKNTTGTSTSPTIQLSSSTDWSYNSDRSLKITGTVESYAVTVLGEILDIETDAQMTGTIHILNNSSFNAQLRFHEVEGNVYNTVEIPSNPNSQEITVTRTKTSNAKTVQLNLILRNPSSVYVDDVSFTIQ